VVFLECLPYYHHFNWYYRSARKAFIDDGGYAACVLPDSFSKHYCTGAAAYLVTPKGRKLLSALFAAMDSEGSFKPIDSTFHDAIHADRLLSWNLLPFLATSALSSFGSLIGYTHHQPGDAPMDSSARWMALMAAFRQLMFIGKVEGARALVQELTGRDAASRDEQLRSILHACLDMRLDEPL
jgi:hypothetical protein